MRGSVLLAALQGADVHSAATTVGKMTLWAASLQAASDSQLLCRWQGLHCAGAHHDHPQQAP